MKLVTLFTGSAFLTLLKHSSHQFINCYTNINYMTSLFILSVFYFYFFIGTSFISFIFLMIYVQVKNH